MKRGPKKGTPSKTKHVRCPTYTDKQKAEALALLALCGGNAKEVSRQLGISATAIGNWARATRTVDLAAERLKREARASQESLGRVAAGAEELKQDLADLFEGAMRRTIAHYLKILPRLDGKTTVAALGMLADRTKALRGEPSTTKRVIHEGAPGRVNVAVLSSEEFTEKMLALIAERKELRAIIDG